MADDPLADYLATLRATTPPGTPLLDRGGDLMDAIAEAIDGAQWRENQPQD
jgi:hypothetical protein